MAQGPNSGKPSNKTLPEGTRHVGCVTEPTTGDNGFSCTVMVMVLSQPSDVRVYVSSTSPPEIPVTKPPASTKAIPGSELIQTPFVDGESEVVFPTQTSVCPEISGLNGILPIIAFADNPELHENWLETENR
jgi:hypothetical protein